MTYKTIMTYLPSPERAGPLLDIVLSVARDNDARHIGLHIVPRVLVPYGIVDVQIPADLIERQRETLQRTASRPRQARHNARACPLRT